MAQYKRRHYFINKQLQTKYIVLTVLLLLAYTALFVVILLTPYIVPLYFDYPLSEQTKAAQMLLNLDKSIWPALGAVILIMSTLSIFVTHKVAGPVYRFKKALADIAEGNLNVSIKLREKDDLKDLAEDLNLVIDELRGFVQALQGDHATMSSCISELEDQIRSNQISNETGQELIRKMQSSRQNIDQTLKKYSN